MVEPISAMVVGTCYALGVAYRRHEGPEAESKRQRKLDKRRKRTMPATLDQVLALETLARLAGRKDGRPYELVLVQYGAYTYGGGGRTMNRKQLKYVEAERMIDRIKREHGVSLTPERPEYVRPDIEGCRPGEEPF